MADFSITAAQVTKDSGISKTGIAGETLTAGQAIYVKSADNRYWKAKANGTAEEQVCAGIVLLGATAGQPISYLDADGGVLTITTGTLGVAGDAVILSGVVAGNICPHADAAAGWRENVIGYMDTTRKKLKFAMSRADVVRGA